MLMLDALTLSIPDLLATLPVRVSIVDPNGGDEITGTVDRELSATHVRLRADDGLVFAVEKTALRILPLD